MNITSCSEYVRLHSMKTLLIFLVSVGYDYATDNSIVGHFLGFAVNRRGTYEATLMGFSPHLFFSICRTIQSSTIFVSIECLQYHGCCDWEHK